MCSPEQVAREITQPLRDWARYGFGAGLCLVRPLQFNLPGILPSVFIASQHSSVLNHGDERSTSAEGYAGRTEWTRDLLSRCMSEEFSAMALRQKQIMLGSVFAGVLYTSVIATSGYLLAIGQFWGLTILLLGMAMMTVMNHVGSRREDQLQEAASIPPRLETVFPWYAPTGAITPDNSPS